MQGVVVRGVRCEEQGTVYAGCRVQRHGGGNMV